MLNCYQNWSDECKLKMIMTYVKVKGQGMSNVVKNVLLLPTLARRITKQVKDDDDELYEGQRSTEVISAGRVRVIAMTQSCLV